MSDYTGDVQVGGPPDRRELPGLVITKLAVGPMANNAYLLRDTASGSQLLIDAAAEPDRLMTAIGPAGLDLIATTHRHRDHTGALSALADATRASTIAHVEDGPHLPVAPGHYVEHGSTITLGATALHVIHLRGHTPGSIALSYQDTAGRGHLFTGDSLFPGGPGKTPTGADFESLMSDLVDRVFTLPDDTWVYPGHGDDTTLGAERPHLRKWRDRGW